jgi:hypothetical protein
VTPTVRRRRLASELRRLREAANLTCEDVAARLECSASKISRIETGRVSVSPRDVRDLALLYCVPAVERDSLVQLARESRQQGWWHAYGDSIQPHVATYIGLESAASQMSIYRNVRIPSLLQTSDYARASSMADAGTTGAPAPDRSAELHKDRQDRTTKRPHYFSAVFGEAALRRQVGGPEVMRSQLEHIIASSAGPGASVQVIPFRSATMIPVELPFGILGFPDPADRDVVCVRYPTGLLWIEDTAEVELYNVLFDQLRACALSPADSVDLVASVLKES